MSEDLQYALAAKEAFANDGKADAKLGALGAALLIEFAQAESDRRQTEERWLKDLRQYRGQYDPEVLAAIGPLRSRAFVRKTRVKVKTVDSRVDDLLFPSGSEKNWEVGPTPVPSVSPEMRSRVIQQLQAMQAQEAAMQQQAGQPSQPTQLTKEMVDAAITDLCKKAAKQMAKVIDDQLTEVRYRKMCKQAAHSAHLFGTGIIKGPLVERRVRSTFVNEGGKWTEKSESYVVPFVDYVPIWRFYPDMNADTLAQCRYVYERHQMTHADLGELAERKSFDRIKIVEYLKSHPKGEVTIRYIDSELKLIGERDTMQSATGGKFEVLERWGWLRGEELRSIGVAVADDRLHESFFSNVWLLPNSEVIKAVLQPINGVTWPYHLYYFDKDETNIFGEGLATIMRDDQTMLNAATRLMLDNAAITAGAMLEVTPSLLADIINVDQVVPWKIYMRNNQSPGHPAVRAIDLPSRLGELSGLADRFETNADEVSAVPRYMTGENVNSGAGATASGMSMLMGAANIMIKDLIGSWDEGITQPFITALYRWNMQFHPDNTIKGDFDVKARGSSSLVAREVRARQLDNFAATTANPMDSPYIKRDALLRQRAEANELSDVVKTEDEVKEEQSGEVAQMQQKLMQMQQQLVVDELAKKVELLTAQAEKAMADVDLIRAKAMETRVETIYTGLQAGGVAMGNPGIAPAGDSILQSSGWEDQSPGPGVADLNQVAQQMPPEMQAVAPPEMAMPEQPGAPDMQPQSGHEGQQAGIETAAV